MSDTYTTTEWTVSPFKAGRFDAFDNLLAQPLVTATWASSSLTPELSGSAAGIDWVPKDAEDDEVGGTGDAGEITIAYPSTPSVSGVTMPLVVTS